MMELLAEFLIATFKTLLFSSGDRPEQSLQFAFPEVRNPWVLLAPFQAADEIHFLSFMGMEAGHGGRGENQV